MNAIVAGSVVSWLLRVMDKQLVVRVAFSLVNWFQELVVEWLAGC